MEIGALAVAADCSEWHLRNIIAGRKAASLKLAKRLSDITGNEVGMEAFLRAATAPAQEPAQ